MAGAPWAQRTGEVFIPGAQTWVNGARLIPTTATRQYPCPLCQKPTYNLSLHWLMNCSAFDQEYKQCAELQWQQILTFIRKILPNTQPTHAIFTTLQDKQSPQAVAAKLIPSIRLQHFWHMDGMGNPSAHIVPFLNTLHTSYDQLILNLQRVTSKTNSRILGKGTKKLGAFPCTTLDAC